MFPVQSWTESSILLSLTHTHPFQNYKIKYIYAGEVVGEGKEGDTDMLLTLSVPISRLAFGIPSPNERMNNTMKKNPKSITYFIKKL